MARKRRRGRREGGPADGAPEADDPEPPEIAPARRVAKRRAALFGEFLRYCVISGLLLVFAPGLGAIVAFFWGIGLARRAYAEFAVPALERRWTERELERRAGGERRLGRVRAGAEAPPRTALQLDALVEAALASRSERLSERGVALRHEGACEAPVKGDAELLARAVDALLDAAEEDLGARRDPRRLDVELGCSLDGSEAWLRLRSRGGGGGAEPSALGGARRVAEAHGGRLEVNTSAAGGLEQVLTLPTAGG